MQEPAPECRLTHAVTRLRAALTDRYRLERELGAGGMATVYLAHDLKHDRQVAVKVLRPELALSLGAERFLAEIKVTARLHHPHILPLYDSGEADGFLFYVMPLVEGESLRARITREKQLPVDQALQIAREVGDALAYAHARDVVHRDIKPENILLEGGHALVADFGIARALSAAGGPRMTQTGLAIGTPGYMSPEQASGEPAVDGRSDLYSLACVLFEMLAGEPPFTGATPEVILVQRFTQPPPRLSTRRDGVPSGLDAALHRALARDPADRFSTVARFAEALTATPARGGATAEKSIAVLPFANMSATAEDEYFSDGMTEEIINALTQLEGLRVAARTSAFSFKGKNEDLRVIGEKLNVSTVLEGSVRKAGNRLRIMAQLINVADGYHLWSERYDRELTDVFAIQDEIASAIAAKLKVTLTAERQKQLVRPGTSNLEAYQLYLQGLALLAQRGRAIVQALECFQRAVALDPRFAQALARVADAYRLLAMYGARPPGEAMPPAKAAAQRALEINPDLDEAYSALASVQMTYDRDPAPAARSWDRALTLNPHNTQARGERGLWVIMVARGALEEAILEVGRAAQSDPLSAWAAGMHSLILGIAGRHAEAVAEARRAVEVDPEAFIAWWALLEACTWASDYPNAIAAAESALAMSGRHPWALGTLGSAHGRAGHQDSAEAVYAELLARARSEYVQPFWLAAAAAAAGHLDEAMVHAGHAVDQRDPLAMTAKFWPDWAPLRAHPGFGEILHRLGLQLATGIERAAH